MNDPVITTYQGRPCSVSKMTVGNTNFTVISVQSDHARETAYEKVKKLILSHSGDMTVFSADNSA